jgi:hypothetical protein
MSFLFLILLAFVTIFGFIIYKLVIFPLYYIILYKIKYGDEIYAYYYPVLGIYNLPIQSAKKFGNP